MPFTPTARFNLVLAAVALALGGCLERKEHITISPQGSVSLELRYKTDSMNDLLQGDAMPTPPAGWAVEQKSQRDDEGKESVELLALAAFPPGFALPANFALKNDADSDLYLQFPTTVTIEKRRDGTYYHFHRLYPARPHQFIERLRERLVQEPLKGIEVEPAQWSDEHRMLVVRALANFESEKMLILGRAALRKATPRVAQDGWLAVCADIRQFVARMDYASMAKLLEPKTEQEKNADETEKKIEAESQRFEESLVERLGSDMHDLAGCEASQVNAFMAEYARQKKAFAITEDLNDEKFEITVEMPGHIVASNADQINGSSAVWGFDGQQFHDVEMELMVTSRILK